MTPNEILADKIAGLLESLLFLAGVGMAIGLAVWAVYRGWVFITDVLMGRYS